MAALKRKYKILIALGTRPEAIKLAPVIQKLKKNNDFQVKVLLTSQHEELLKQVLQIFGIKKQVDFHIMKPGQSLFSLTGTLLQKFQKFFLKHRPNLLIVQGDTTSAFIAALAAFYNKIPIAHVEAGLRSFNKFNPFPEEINRKFISHLADIHFAPTLQAKKNLIREGIKPKKIYVTGNTVVDALHIVKEKWSLKKNFSKIDRNKKIIFITAHRRENQGQPLINICNAIKEISRRWPETEFVYPVHPSPAVRLPVFKLLSHQPRIHLLSPLDYLSSLGVLKRSYFVLTDSGGLQEEAPSFQKPVLVLRKTTERPEGIRAGCAKLVGVKKDNIIKEVEILLQNQKIYREMMPRKNPYGDGKAAKRIGNILRKLFLDNKDGKH